MKTKLTKIKTKFRVEKRLREATRTHSTPHWEAVETFKFKGWATGYAEELSEVHPLYEWRVVENVKTIKVREHEIDRFVVEA